ncbi:MAG: hypothetical protein JWO89_1257 [Verrucomicrobiaceae bacterium]|nr:hypothetical protein [Verrucomicrobiaceae bacterium]
MKIFQRFEVWLLIALSAVAMVVVFKPFSKSKTEGLISNATPADESAKAAPQVHRLTLVRDFGNARLDVDVRLTNKHAKKLQLVAPTVKLMAGKDRQIPDFFLPVEPPPEIPAKTTADVHLRFWLEKGDLAGKLTLQFDGESVDLKSDKPFDLGQVKNAEPKVLGAGDW